jgi:broad specificity phosphatase PhoE
VRLFLARHGATQHNLDGRLTGQIDAPLSALGERQAEALAQRLAGWRFDAIIASDLVRARATAEAIATYHPTPTIQLDADIREIDMGVWAGRPYAEWEDEERRLFAAIECDPTGRIHAPGGESFAALAERVDRALRRTLEQYADGTVLWVTHGGVIGVLLVRALGLGFHQRRQFRRANCSLFELRYEGESVILARLNDTSHLAALEVSEVGESRQAF